MMEEDKIVETTVESYESEIDSSERKSRSRERGQTRNPEPIVQTV